MKTRDNDNDITIINPLVNDNDNDNDNDIDIINKCNFEQIDIETETKNETEKICVICLEIYDNNKNISILHSNLINAECDCEYYIHKTCFAKWLKNRPTNEITCLICSSKATPVLTYEQLCEELLRKPGCKKTIICIYKSIVWCGIIIICWFFFGILDERTANNNYE